MVEHAPGNPIQTRTITVRTGRLVCDVVVSDARFRYSTPRLAAFISRSHPDLPHHACVNDEGPVFGAVIERTSTPHVLEHLVISEQTSAAVDATGPFMGTTEWIDEAAGEARVQVSFRDDLEALRAFNKAVKLLNEAVLTCLS